MKLIPVVDIMGGHVVRAVRGDRGSYRPVVSALCRSSDPVMVARILVEHCAAGQLYVADLDALQGGAPQVEVIAALAEALRGIELWVDAGFADAAAAEALARQVRITPVFGSESLVSVEDGIAETDAVLSLDRRDGRRLDAAGAWEAPSLWPRRVIVMTLERVGADAGPDLDTLAEVRARSSRTELIGAGGVRNTQDLSIAAAAGASGWLVASALHDLRIPRALT